MRKIIIVFIILLNTFLLYTSENDADELINKAVGYMQNGKYEEAIEFCNNIEKELKDESSQSQIYFIKGICYYNLGIFKKALDNYLKSLAIYNKLVSEEDDVKGTIYNNLGLVYDNLGNYQEALTYYFKSLEIYRKILGEEHNLTATSYNNIGLTYRALGYYEKALDYHFKSLDIYKKVSGERHSSTATCYNNIGFVYDKMSNYEEALVYYFKSLDIYKEIHGEEHNLTATIYNNIGLVYKALGNYEEALTYYFKALNIYKKVFGMEHFSIATNYNNIGLVYGTLGNYKEALDYHFKSLDIRLKVFGILHPDTAASYNNIGLVYIALGNYEEALTYYFKSVDICNKILGEEHPLTATSYNNIGVIYDNMGNYEKALSYYVKSLDIYRKIHGEEHHLTATCYNNMGYVYDKMSNYEEALIYYFKSLDIRLKVLGKDHPITAESYNNIAYQYYNVGEYKKSKEYFIKSIEIIEKLRKNVSMNKETKAIFFETRLDTYYGLVDSLYKLKEYDTAYYYCESTKSRALLDELSMDILFTSVEIDKEYRNKLNDIKIKIISFQNKIADKKLNDDSFDNEMIKLKKLEEEYKKTVYEIYKKYPKYKELSEGKVFNLKSIQAKLNNNDVIIEYLINNSNKGYIFIVLKNDFKMIKLDDNILSNYKSDIEVFRDIISNPIGMYFFNKKTGKIYSEEHDLKKKENNEIIDSKKAQKIINDRLFKLLIESVKDYINDKNIIIIPDSELAFFPFEVLKDRNNKYLVTIYDISYNQSASMLVKSRELNIKSEKPIIAFGGAEYKGKSNNQLIVTELNELQKDYYRNRGVKDFYTKRGYSWVDLPGTLEEVTKIGRLFYKRKKDTDKNILTGGFVTEEIIKEIDSIKGLENYRIIHFATHGVINYEIPELSSIVLSQVEETLEDGYLTLIEILQLDLNAEIVTLSACETGLGKITGGEGVTGLAQSFIMSGSKNVCMTLWSIDDKSTSEFMINFYKKVREGMTYKNAMLKTKREFIMKGSYDPYHWAPFILYGE